MEGRLPDDHLAVTSSPIWDIDHEMPSILKTVPHGMRRIDAMERESFIKVSFLDETVIKAFYNISFRGGFCLKAFAGVREKDIASFTAIALRFAHYSCQLSSRARASGQTSRCRHHTTNLSTYPKCLRGGQKAGAEG
jgi:hypothetical protein